MKGICSLSIVPVRKEPGDRSEMVTQLLFGETFTITGSEKSWSKIDLDFDGYSGWIDTKQATPFDEEEYKKLTATAPTVALDLLQLAITGKEIITVVMGSSLPFYYGKKFFINGKEFIYDGNIKTITQSEISKVAEYASMFLNAPYLWGGRSPFGLDCSGFTQVVFKMSGIKLLRDASQQAGQGKRINSIDEIQEGDLAFFKNEDRKIVHVGIVLNNKHIIHSSGKVRIDSLNEQGIINADTGKQSHVLAEFRRIH